MTEEGSELVIAIAIDRPELADRVSKLLAGLPGIRLAGADEPSDLALVATRGELGGAETGLTRREREVLTLLAEGASNKTIARRLGISAHTVKFHVGSLIDKLDATGRTDAVAHAARIGVIHL